MAERVCPGAFFLLQLRENDRCLFSLTQHGGDLRRLRSFMGQGRETLERHDGIKAA